jgi:hypothetical protein
MCHKIVIFVFIVAPQAWAASLDTVEIAGDVLADKIGGGLLGQLLGNLNGLPHEMKYIKEPGRVTHYTPLLPEGARTDDDTDIEWVYIIEMQRSGEVQIPPQRIAELWRKHINGGIWCANLYARGLMDLGLAPPLTGRMGINPWASFNVSGQFICEAFGLVAPGMPQTAARTGLHYTQVAIDGEPAQATQLFTSMIATAFIESDILNLVNAGRAAVDPKSEIYQVTGDVLDWWKANPGNWRATWDQIREKYMRYDGDVRDRNGCQLNTAAVISALLYGQRDFVETIRHAFNFGWDADCNAATAGTIIGVIKGRRWILEQGWTIADRYQNRSRPGMPSDETITRYSERLADVAANIILANGGSQTGADGRKVYRIRLQKPAMIEPLVRPDDRLAELRQTLLPDIEKDLAGDSEARAGAAYLALCLGQAERLSKERPQDWSKSIDALNRHRSVIENIFKAPDPIGSSLQAKARAMGLQSRPSR